MSEFASSEVSSQAPEIPSSGLDFAWPAQGQVLYRFDEKKGVAQNQGIDIQAPAGSPVFAVADGTVSFAHEQLKGYGRTIIVNHPDGFQSVYVYLLESLVTVGDKVKKNQQIASLGMSGRAETNFLHFQLRHQNRPIDPLKYFEKTHYET